MSRKKLREYHLEVAQALTAMGNPVYGKAVQEDRGSQLKHLGITFPDLRRGVRQGFSFSSLPEEQVLEVWDALWKTSPYADVLFAALEFYTSVVRKGVVGPYRGALTPKPAQLWPVVRQWIDRVDNWCHSDRLSAIYSRLLEAKVEEIYPQMASWNTAESEWRRRVSLVSLIH